MGSDGIRIARGNAARYARDAQIIPWSDAAERISELLDTGQYAGSWELERAASTERELLAQQIVYLYRDLADGQENSLFPEPRRHKKWTVSRCYRATSRRYLPIENSVKRCSSEYRDFLAAYRGRPQRPALPTTTRQMRYSTRSKASSCRGYSFTADAEIIPSPHQFITQDEIDALLRDGGSTSGGKWRIFRYFYRGTLRRGQGRLPQARVRHRRSLPRAVRCSRQRREPRRQGHGAEQRWLRERPSDVAADGQAH